MWWGREEEDGVARYCCEGEDGVWKSAETKWRWWHVFWWNCGDGEIVG